MKGYRSGLKRYMEVGGPLESVRDVYRRVIDATNRQTNCSTVGDLRRVQPLTDGPFSRVSEEAGKFCAA